ncbi:hypothetical protein Zmor_007635 [Zophobas morio]|uniref:7tm 6 domain containing protein n=1 Tax=Zophobas morio TaxID=2755281 RepID=A0AA38IYQ1_9CUCU|nr:hypothetical protein Zmor_007635 [Zophobas morio]
MNKFDWKAATRINISMLKIVGLWPKGDEAYKFNIYTMYAIISINLFINGHTFFQVMNIFFVYSNLEALSSTVFITVSEFLAAVKVYYYVQNIKLLKKLQKDLEKDIFQPRNQHQIFLIQPNLQMWRTTYFTFCVPCAATVALWSVIPILDQTIKEYRLPVFAWYPYNTKISPLYEITYFYQVISLWFLGIANLNIDSLISALMTYVSALCDILSDDIKTLKSESENIHEKIIFCVRRHQEVLGFASGCNKFFDFITLGQFITSVITSAVTMFHLTVVEPFSNEFYSLLIFAACVPIQLFLYCWFGNEVELKVRIIMYFLKM